MERAVVGPSGLSMRWLFPNLAFVAQMPQNPRAEPAGSLAQLCLPGFGLVLVAVPNPPWAASPLSNHAVQPYPATAGWHHWTTEPIRGNKRQTMNRRRTGGLGGRSDVQEIDCVLGGGRSRECRRTLIGGRCRYVLPPGSQLSAAERWMDTRTTRDDGAVFSAISSFSHAFGNLYVEWITRLSVACWIPCAAPSNSVA
jgi:hypothetical protein